VTLAGFIEINAAVELSTRLDGFTPAQFAETLRQRSGQDATTCPTRNAAYDMAKMVGKALLRRIERSRRRGAPLSPRWGQTV
jgi:hypothetical protein